MSRVTPSLGTFVAAGPKDEPEGLALTETEVQAVPLSEGR